MTIGRPRLFAILCLLAVAACARTQAQTDGAAAGATFMAQNAKASGIQVTASGLQYRILRSGPAAGPHPGHADEVKVNYEGRLLDGQVFDSTYQRGVPATLEVGGVIPGWQEALKLMRPGDTWTVYLPADLAYGDQGAGPIPPGSTLVFKLELIAVNHGAE